jgi:hypothetical protein
MNGLARALLDELDDEALDELARRLAPRLGRHDRSEDGVNGGELLSPAAAAVRVQVHPRTIYRALTAGELQGRKIASRWKIEPGALEAWAQSGGRARSRVPVPNPARGLTGRPALSRSTGRAVAAIVGRT